MTEPDFLSTFAVDPVDPNKDPEQFYHQAYWLGRCANLVYPCGEKEEEADKAAKAAATKYSAASPPWWKLWAKRATKDEIQKARDAMKTAVAAEACMVANRIKKTIENWRLDGAFEFISNVSTQCFVASNDDVIIVCFRGTEVSKIGDIVADLVAIPDSEKEHFVGRAHVGFIAALREAWDNQGTSPRIRGRGLPEVLKEFRNNKQKLWLTGHSLGGALATLAAARLIKEKILAQEEIGGLITFGQPRVGNGEFASEYNDKYDLKKRHFRFVNNNDVVTRMPLPGGFKIGKLPLPEFRHVGRVVFVNRADELEANIGFVRLFFGRLASRFTALFKKPMNGQDVKLIDRILPGLRDHFMKGYERVLTKKVVGFHNRNPGQKPVS